MTVTDATYRRLTVFWLQGHAERLRGQLQSSENRLDDPAGSPLKGYTMMVNGNYNGWRLDDARLEQ